MAVGMTALVRALHLKAMRNEILRRRVKALRLVEVQPPPALAAAGGVSAWTSGRMLLHLGVLRGGGRVLVVLVGGCLRRPPPAAPDRRAGIARCAAPVEPRDRGALIMPEQTLATAEARTGARACSSGRWRFSPSWRCVCAGAAQRRSLEAAVRADRPARTGHRVARARRPERRRPTVGGFSSADLATGEVSVVNFWASWCAPCVQEHPLLVALKERTGVKLYGVNYKDQAATARRFLGRYGNPFAAVGVDANGRAAIDWGVYRHAGDVHRQRQGRDRLQAHRADLGRDAGNQDHSDVRAAATR